MSPVLTVASSAPVADTKASIDWARPPQNSQECLVRIEVLAGRIRDHIQFVNGIEIMTGLSGEVKQQVVTGYYERLLTLDRSLNRLGDSLRLA